MVEYFKLYKNVFANNKYSIPQDVCTQGRITKFELVNGRRVSEAKLSKYIRKQNHS